MNEAAAGGAPLQLPAAACLALCDALPRAKGLDEALRIVDGVRRELLGPGLLTINLNATRSGSAPEAGHGEIHLQRLWSSDRAAFPVAGRKRKTLTAWTRQLLCRAEVFVGEGEQALAQVFDDHGLIASLGLRAVVNVPLLDDQGACFATFNVLGREPRWQPGQVLAIRLLATLATPAVLRAAREQAAER
jgi:hypothetical protein